jgi:hypothetical protein
MIVWPSMSIVTVRRSRRVWTIHVDRARQLAGLKGYVTNLPVDAMAGQAVINAYHDLLQVERSFRMTKSDLRARPVLHHQHEAIEALPDRGVSRPRDRPAPAGHTGMTLKEFVQTLRPLRSVGLAIGGQTIPADPEPDTNARAILDRLPRSAQGAKPVEVRSGS